jgi:poly(beta-D-mannuronate) lyase
MPTSLIAVVVLLALAIPAWAVEIPVKDQKEFKAALKVVRPGETIVLREGTWHNSELVFSAVGTADAPITLRAKMPGKTVFTGTSSLRIGGEYLVVDGLVFQDPDSSIDDLIQFRKDSKQLARHCRMTQCSVVSSNSDEDSQESRWVGVYGKNNRVDHSSFSGKSNKGTTFVVWLGDQNEGQHQIDHNYFGHRENLGRNGGETIRIGDSKTSMSDGQCIVENNLFERCSGEAECISNKSCKNVYRSNTFLEVSGTLTLRHGNECLVESNVFLGGGAKQTGGIRVIGENHVVRGNYLEKLTGDDARSAICLMMGIPDSPLNRYFQVQRARIENNWIVDSKCPVLIGLSDDKKASLEPVETTFVGNQIDCPKAERIIEARCSIAGIQWSDNRVEGKSTGLPETSGISLGEVSVKRPEPISRDQVGPAWQR